MKFLHALNLLPGIGPQKLRLLMNHFSSPEEVWKANATDLVAAGLSCNLSEKIVVERSRVDIDREWEEVVNSGIVVISESSDFYPERLRHIPHAPYILYARGNVASLDKPSIAIVGTRRPTPYGTQAATILAQELSHAGLLVVSGMALGIDSIAHRATLKSQHPTIAVLGNGLSDTVISPSSHLALAHDIASRGCLLSEYAPRTQAGTHTFPARNRIIAGLALGVIVIEAAEHSGSLITATHALEYNREVFAIPGSIFSEASRGSNALIRRGAKAVTGVQDVLDELGMGPAGERASDKTRYVPQSEAEKIILSLVTNESLHIDRIIELTKLETNTVSASLALLEMKGVIRNIGGQHYIRL